MQIKRSTLIPALLSVYLIVMAWIGRSNLTDGHRLQYLSVIGITAVVIVLAHFAIKKREQMRSRNRRH